MLLFAGALCLCWGVEGALKGMLKEVLKGALKEALKGVLKGVLKGALKGVLQGALHGLRCEAFCKPPPFLLLVLEKRVDKLLLVEQLQSLHRLAQTDIFYRHLELVADADDHAALGCAVELGDGK